MIGDSIVMDRQVAVPVTVTSCVEAIAEPFGLEVIRTSGRLSS